jgi:peptidyl-tRNA hydrolase
VPDAAVGVPYEIVLQVTNSSNLIAWSKLSGDPWFSIATNGTTSALGSGTPTVVGVNPIAIQAVDTVTGAVGTITL